jgi:adenine-specific DNA-methyltransferase
LEENKFIKDLERYLSDGQLTKVSDIFTIKQGALAGVKNIFKIQCEVYKKLPKKEQNYFRPVITNDSIKCGQIFLIEYIWYPYDKSGITIRSEDELNSITFATNYLFPNKDILLSRKGINEWWSLTRPRNWQFEKESRLYSNRFGNSDSFAFDSIGNYVIEEGNAFIPRRVFKEGDYYFYLSCFSSNIFDKLLSIFSKPIMSGFDLGQIQIKNIPVPNVHLTSVSESDAYVKLVELGKELEKGNSFVKQVINDVLKNYFYPRS